MFIEVNDHDSKNDAQEGDHQGEIQRGTMSLNRQGVRRCEEFK